MEQSDDELITQYFAGDRESFSILVERYTPLVYSFTRRLVRNATEAEDITQETFVKAWKKLDTYRLGEQFKTWLLSIAKNTALDWLRKKKSYVFSDFETDETSLEENLGDPAPLSDELFAKREDKEYLKEILEKLNPLYREVLLLHYTEEMTFDEIGKVLGKPLDTVKSQHRRALIMLRKLMDAPNEKPKT